MSRQCSLSALLGIAVPTVAACQPDIVFLETETHQTSRFLEVDTCLSCSGDGCAFPKMTVVLDIGLPPADTEGRPSFHPGDYDGSDTRKVQHALWDAQLVDGAVVLDRVYETTATIKVDASVLVTGGGLRRACSPVTTLVSATESDASCLELDDAAGFAPNELLLVTSGSSYDDSLALLEVAAVEGQMVCARQPIEVALPAGARVIRHHNLLALNGHVDDVVIDSVLFDGANRCNDATHDWRYNNAVVFRGQSTIKNSLIYDSPSESITTCGATLRDNLAFELQGSIVHKSCAAGSTAPDRLERNYVERANLAGDELMAHSEGVITLSANAGDITARDNVFRFGGEGAWGYVQEDDQDIRVSGDCYESFPHVLRLDPDVGTEGYTFDVTLVDVPTAFAQ